MNAEAIRENAPALADEMCRMIAEVKCSPLSIADEALAASELSDTVKAQILYALVMATQIVAEEAMRVAALAMLAGKPCPCEKCQAARQEEGPVQ